MLIIAGILGVVMGVSMTYILLHKGQSNRFAYIEKEVKAKSKAIEKETELLVKSSQMKIQEKELEQEREFQKRLAQVDERDRQLIYQIKEVSSSQERFKLLEKRIL
jgi:hypothetical protein